MAIRPVAPEIAAIASSIGRVDIRFKMFNILYIDQIGYKSLNFWVI